MSDLRLHVEEPHLIIVRTILAACVSDREVWAFGSRVSGRVKRYSDLDLAVIGESALPLLTLGELQDRFSDSDLPYRVDLVDWASTSQEFRGIIAAKKIVVQAGNSQADSCGS